MNKTLTAIFLLLWIAGNAQTTPLSLISTAGNNLGTTTIAGTSYNVDWTIGEVLIGSGTSGSQNITIGEQQPGYVYDHTGVQEVIFGNVKLYPNPLNKVLNIENLPFGENSITLQTLDGKKVLELSSHHAKESIDISAQPAGIYLLTLSANQSIASYKLSITK